MEERYKRGVIYTIRNRNDDTLIYVGSTINNLSKRFNNHKSKCKIGKEYNLYKHIINNDWSDWYIELYENYPCNNKKELNRREGQVIREIGTINKYVAGRTFKEYRCENADKIREIERNYQKENVDKIKERKAIYYINNLDMINNKKKEKVCCDICGSFIRKDGLREHQKTKKCIEATKL